MTDDPAAPTAADPGVLRPLLDDALRGDRESLHALMELLATDHYRRIVGFLRKHSAARTQTIEVAFQDSMVHFHELAEKGEVDIHGDVLQWVMYFCLRTLRNARKVRKTPVHDRNWNRMTAVLENLEARNLSGPATLALRHEAEDALHHAVDELPARMKEVLELHLKGLSPDEIAIKLGIAVKTVYDIQDKAKARVLLGLAPAGAPPPKKAKTDPKAAAFIKTAVASLPADLRRVIDALHFQGVAEASLDDRQRKLRDEAYKVLSKKLGVPFPDAFKSPG